MAKTLADVATSLKDPEIFKLQLLHPVTTPMSPYTFIEKSKHRAVMTAQQHGVDVVLKPAPNKPAGAYQHFLVPWHNIAGVFYAVVADEKAEPVVTLPL